MGTLALAAQFLPCRTCRAEHAHPLLSMHTIDPEMREQGSPGEEGGLLSVEEVEPLLFTGT